MQCYKGLGYIHRTTKCRNEEVCYGNHKSGDYNKEIIDKCFKCTGENERLNLDLGENHNTNHRDFLNIKINLI